MAKLLQKYQYQLPINKWLWRQTRCEQIILLISNRIFLLKQLSSTTLLPLLLRKGHCRKLRPIGSRGANLESSWCCQRSWLCLTNEEWPRDVNGLGHLVVERAYKVSLLLNKWVCCIPFIRLICPIEAGLLVESSYSVYPVSILWG